MQTGIEEHRRLVYERGGAIRQLDTHVAIWSLFIEPIAMAAFHAWHGWHSQLFPAWANRPIYTSIVNSSDVNAVAIPGKDADHIFLYSGLIERLYGYALALFGTREFLPTIGDSRKECRLRHSVKFFEQRCDLRSGTASLNPVCSTRKTLAGHVALLALNVALLHEFGHILGGHFQLVRRGVTSLELDELSLQTNPVLLEVPLSVIEWDADCFAISFFNSLYHNMDVSGDISSWLSATVSEPQNQAMVLCTLGGHILFRCLCIHSSYTYAFDPSRYPSPPMRGFNFLSEIIMRRNFQNIVADQEVIRIYKNIEKVCARRFGIRREDSTFFDSLWLSPVMWDVFVPHRQRLEDVRRMSWSWRPLYRPA
jgi:hypothetical protein